MTDALSPPQAVAAVCAVLLWCWGARSDRRRLAAFVCILATVALLYLRCLDYGFLRDDFFFARPLTPAQLLSTLWGDWDPLAIANQHYRPVVALSLALDYALWGPQPWGYHLTSLLILAAAALAGWALLRELTGAEPIALAGACAWIAHPLTSPVAGWCNQRTDSIMALFYLGALWALVRGRHDGRARAATLVLGALALGSKEMAVTLPLTAALLVLALRAPERGRRLVTVALLGALCVAFSAAWFLLFQPKAEARLAGFEPWTALDHVPRLLVPVFAPTDHTLAWSAPPPLRSTAWGVAFALLAAWALAAGRDGARVPRTNLWAGALWTLLTLPPLFGRGDQDILRLGLLIAFGAALCWASVVQLLGPRARTPAIALLALWLVPPAVSSAEVWGPRGFRYRQSMRQNARQAGWRENLSPEMRALFERQWAEMRDPARPDDQ